MSNQSLIQIFASLGYPLEKLLEELPFLKEEEDFDKDHYSFQVKVAQALRKATAKNMRDLHSELLINGFTWSEAVEIVAGKSTK